MRVIERFLVNDRNNTRVALPGLTVQTTFNRMDEGMLKQMDP
jgi:hypothetical protein